MTDKPYIPRAVPAYFATVLRSLGYRVHLHDIPAAAISNALRRHLQLSVDRDWLAAYPDPPLTSAVLPQISAGYKL